MSQDYSPFEPSVEQNVDLSAFDDEFQSVAPAELDEVPDGKYQVRTHTVRLAHSQNGNPMIKWDLLVIAGQLAGRHIFKNSVITQASLPFVKGDLKTLGMELTKLSELRSRLEELLDLTIEVTKRTRGAYTNVYFNRRIEIPSGAALPESEIPF